MNGLMQQQPLLISSLLVHAERHHGSQEIVSRRLEGDIHRTTYRELAARARRLAKALQALKIQDSDRVATLAWNGHRHMEMYYAVSGIGAVLHTLNPRLHPDQLSYIADHAEDQVLFFDADLPAAGRGGGGAAEDRQALRADDRPRAHAGAEQGPEGLLCYEDLIDAQDDRLRVAELRREPRQFAVLHQRHHRQPQGRAVQPPLDGAARLRRGPARCAELLGARRHPAGGADVPRQRLGPALRRPAWSARSWSSPAPGWTASRCTSCSRPRRSPCRPACRRSGRACWPTSKARRPEVQHDEAHRDRRLGLPAGDDPRLPARTTACTCCTPGA